MNRATALLLSFIAVFPAYSYAEQTTEEQNVVVRDKAESPLTNSTTLTADDIQQRPTGNGGITELLKTNPAVQFSNSGDNSLSQGEISPAKISIHGATSYQNAFTLDGVSVNNDLDPADGGLGVTATKLGSDEQGFYIDANLVESVTVYDSNIPVEFGGFVGGVVDTKTKSWNGETSAKIYYRQTDSSWGEQVYDDKLKFDSGENDVANPARFQPSYSKSSYGVSLATGISENLGFVASLSRRESEIPMINAGGTSAGLDENNQLYFFETKDKTQDQNRTSDNLFAKLTWYASARTTAHASVAYSGYTADMFQNGVANSEYTTDHDGVTGTLQLQHMFDVGTGEVTASYQTMTDERDATQNYLVSVQDWSDWQNPTSYQSGGPGDLKSEQNNIGLKAKMTFNAIEFVGLEHKFTFGAEINRTDAKYIRDENYYQNNYSGNQDAAMGSQNVMFAAGTYKADYNNGGIFVEDVIELGNVTLRPGVRIERDTFVDETNIAPRFAADWDLFGDNNTVITAGANRYFGRSILAYALYEGQNGGMHLCNPGYDDNWNMIPCTPNSPDNNWQSMTDYEGLDSLESPYSDEFTIKLTQIWGNSLWSLGYVHRNNKDEVLTRYEEKNPGEYCAFGCYNRVFSNEGESTSDNVNLTVTNRMPIKFAGTSNQISASLVWQDLTSNYAGESGYDQSENPIGSGNFDYDKVWYDGEIINAADLPSTDFNAPLRATIELVSTLPSYDITLYNLWQWKDGREQATRHDNTYATDPATGMKVYKYERVDFSDTFRWDMKAQWQPQFAKGAAVAVEVTNLLNNENATDSFVHQGEVYKVYESGRQFWLQLSYDY